MRCRGFYEAGCVLTPERTRLIVAQCRFLRAFAIVNHIPPDSVLPEDVELLEQAGSEESPEYQVEIDLRQAELALQAALQRERKKGKDANGKKQTG